MLRHFLSKQIVNLYQPIVTSPKNPFEFNPFTANHYSVSFYTHSIFKTSFARLRKTVQISNAQDAQDAVFQAIVSRPKNTEFIEVKSYNPELVCWEFEFFAIHNGSIQALNVSKEEWKEYCLKREAS